MEPADALLAGIQRIANHLQHEWQYNAKAKGGLVVKLHAPDLSDCPKTYYWVQGIMHIDEVCIEADGNFHDYHHSKMSPKKWKVTQNFKISLWIFFCRAEADYSRIFILWIFSVRCIVLYYSLNMLTMIWKWASKCVHAYASVCLSYLNESEVYRLSHNYHYIVWRRLAAQ